VQSKTFDIRGNKGELPCLEPRHMLMNFRCSITGGECFEFAE